MARYRQKTHDELVWNDIRRRLTRQLDVEVAAVRERILNSLLTGAFEEYTKALESGEEIQLESHVAAWVADAMTEALKPKVESLDLTNL